MQTGRVGEFPYSFNALADFPQLVRSPGAEKFGKAKPLRVVAKHA